MQLLHIFNLKLPSSKCILWFFADTRKVVSTCLISIPSCFISLFSVLTPADSSAILRKIKDIRIIRIITINVEIP